MKNNTFMTLIDLMLGSVGLAWVFAVHRMLYVPSISSILIILVLFASFDLFHSGLHRLSYVVNERGK